MKSDLLGNVKVLSSFNLSTASVHQFWHFLAENQWQEAGCSYFVRNTPKVSLKRAGWKEAHRHGRIGLACPVCIWFSLHYSGPIKKKLLITPYETSGLDFTAQSLRHNVDNSSAELSISFREAYGNTLKPHHNMFVKPVFSAAMSATPYRKDFYSKLGSNPEKVQTALSREVEALEKRVAILKEFLSRKEAKW